MPALAGLILAMLAERSPAATVCPSEVARRAAADGDWRALVADVRAAAAGLAADGCIRVTQRGRPVDPLAARGPIRLGRAAPG